MSLDTWHVQIMVLGASESRTLVGSQNWLDLGQDNLVWFGSLFSWNLLPLDS